MKKRRIKEILVGFVILIAYVYIFYYLTDTLSIMLDYIKPEYEDSTYFLIILYYYFIRISIGLIRFCLLSALYGREPLDKFKVEVFSKYRKSSLHIEGPVNLNTFLEFIWYFILFGPLLLIAIIQLFNSLEVESKYGVALFIILIFETIIISFGRKNIQYITSKGE